MKSVGGEGILEGLRRENSSVRLKWVRGGYKSSRRVKEEGRC